MPKRKKSEPSTSHDSNYDEPWKAFIVNHFRAFLNVYFAGMAGNVDWNTEPVFDPTEVSQFLGTAKRRNKFVDVIVQVTLLTGEQQIVLLHFEVQTNYSSDLGKRLYLLNCGLQWQFPEYDVVSLVIRTDLARKWEQLTYHFELDEYSLNAKFPTCKISENLKTTWVDDFTLPVMVARAQIEALRTSSDAEARYEAKKQLIRMLYEHKYERDEVLEILRYLDWMMHLSEDLERRLREELKAIKSERFPEMTEYITSWERFAKEEGKEEGKAEMVLRLLQKSCGELSESQQKRVSALAGDQLERLFDAALAFTSLDDLSNWLEKHGA
ncbi:MAG: DUF4351 domain-containing protein [Verrucomicrobiales bacterium]|nr:DUF4351 domain-containing protein [Verrucomicrobiales bacterium]